MRKNNLRDCLTAGDWQRATENKKDLRIFLDASPQKSTRNLRNLLTHPITFPVDLCTDLLYTVHSEHEKWFNTHLLERAERAADVVSTMLTIKHKQNRS
jgi:hypothetical protein